MVMAQQGYGPFLCCWSQWLHDGGRRFPAVGAGGGRGIGICMSVSHSDLRTLKNKLVVSKVLELFLTERSSEKFPSKVSQSVF